MKSGLQWEIVTRSRWYLFGIRFEPRDLWGGVYWERIPNVFDLFEIWICIVPMLPLFYQTGRHRAPR